MYLKAYINMTNEITNYIKANPQKVFDANYILNNITKFYCDIIQEKIAEQNFLIQKQINDINQKINKGEK